jgi:hypothetical protein
MGNNVNSMENKSVPLPGQKVSTWRKWGTGSYDGWLMGDKVTSLSELKEGEFYLEDKEHLSLLNMVKVRVPEDGKDIMAMITYVDPARAPQKRLGADKEHAVWESHFEGTNKVAFYRVHRAN